MSGQKGVTLVGCGRARPYRFDGYQPSTAIRDRSLITWGGGGGGYKTGGGGVMFYLYKKVGGVCG